MYYYIVDPQKIGQKHFERVQNQLHSSLSELKINGEMNRVTSIKTISQLVDSAFMRGAGTIVAVGHDSTVQEIINALGEREMTIGYVPLQESEFSTVLGITDVANACQNLAHRRVENLDLGKVNSSYFLTKIGLGMNLDSLQSRSVFDFGKFAQASGLKPTPIKMEVDNQFSAEFEVAVGAIFNSRAAKCDTWVADPTDSQLDILLLPGLTAFDAWKYRVELASGCLEKIPGCAVMHGKNIKISDPYGLQFMVGNNVIAESPAVIEILPKKVRVIVGKDRTF
jgi:diacylglycerol kinase family enzyme